MSAPNELWIATHQAESSMNRFEPEAGSISAYTKYTRTDLLPPPAADYVAMSTAVEKHLTWFERFICDRDELDSSTPRKVAENAKDAAVELRQALTARPASPDTRVTDAMIEKATMVLLGHGVDLSPGVDWVCARDWTVNQVRTKMGQALRAILEGGQDRG